MLSLALRIILVAAEAGIVFLVLAKNNRSRVNRYLAASIVGIIIWTVSDYMSDKQTSSVILWNRLVFLGPIVIAYSYWSMVRELVSVRVNRSTSVFSVFAFIGMAALTLTPYIVADVHPRDTSNGAPQGFDLVHGPLYVLFVLYFGVLMGWAIFGLYRRYKKSKNLQLAQTRLILLGTALSTIWGFTTNVLLSVLLGSSVFAQYGPVSGVIFSVFLSYAIIKHRFLDIRVVVARSVAYLILLVLLGLAFVIGAFQIGGILFPGTKTSTGEEIYNVVLALILAFTFQPLRRFFERRTEKLFYRDRYDSQEVLNNFTGILVSELDLARILKRSLTTLCESLHIQFGQIIVFNNERAYRIEHYGPLPQRLMVAPELRQLNRSMLIADELESGERKTLLEGHGVRVSLMLSTRDQFVGYLLLGDKLSGDIYSNQDIELLEIIRKELAVAILNAKAYAEIQAFNVTLQARVDHATNRLRVANRHLQELDKAKDEFISMASHQLRTPLTTIKGYLSMMLEGDAGPISSGQQDFVQFAYDASERMVNLISDLLNISRLNAGRFLIQRTPTDMVQMIEDEVRQAMPHAAQKGIRLVFNKPDHPLPPAEIDENKTRQVIMNFIDNAIYYTQKGEVRVTLRQTGDMVHLEVHDTGIGVPEEARKKLFSKFYRAENAQTVRPDGTGLGLYLAKRVIQDQDGTIIFSSVEGKGSTFGFELPFKPKPVKHKEKKKQHA